jgi:hypothetical protein
MAKSSASNYFLPKNDEVRRILDNLTRYPLYIEATTHTTQTLGKYKWARNARKKKHLFIENGIVGIPNTVVLKKTGNGYEFVIK